MLDKSKDRNLYIKFYNFLMKTRNNIAKRSPRLIKFVGCAYDVVVGIYEYLADIPFLCGILKRKIFPNAKSQYDHIKELKNKHKGERCFIVMTGPSLTLDDINKLYEQREICFTVNSGVKLYDKTDWRADYYFTGNPRDLMDFTPELISEMERTTGKNCYFGSTLTRRFLLTAGEISPEERRLISKEFGGKFSFYPSLSSAEIKLFLPLYIRESNPYEVDHSWGTIANVALNFAVYMGFSEIFLLGADCDWSGPKMYADPVKQSSGITVTPEWGISFLYNKREMDTVFLWYEALKKYADSRGQKIFNVTRGGKLEVFPRVDLDEVLARKEKLIS